MRHRRTVVTLAAIAIAAATLTGCSKSSYSCHNASCDVSVSGNATVDLSGEHNEGGPSVFEVTGYDGDSVDITSSSVEETVKAGETKRVGALTFKVVSVDGDSAKLHVEG